MQRSLMHTVYCIFDVRPCFPFPYSPHHLHCSCQLYPFPHHPIISSENIPILGPRFGLGHGTNYAIFVIINHQTTFGLSSPIQFCQFRSTALTWSAGNIAAPHFKLSSRVLPQRHRFTTEPLTISHTKLHFWTRCQTHHQLPRPCPSWAMHCVKAVIKTKPRFYLPEVEPPSHKNHNLFHAIAARINCFSFPVSEFRNAQI